MANPFASIFGGAQPTGYVNDFDVQAAQLARRRKIAEMLQAQTLQGIETTPGVRMSWTQPLAKVLQGLGANYVGGEADTGEAALTQARDKAFQEKLAALGDKVGATPERMLPELNREPAQGYAGPGEQMTAPTMIPAQLGRDASPIEMIQRVAGLGQTSKLGQDIAKEMIPTLVKSAYPKYGAGDIKYEAITYKNDKGQEVHGLRNPHDPDPSHIIPLPGAGAPPALQQRIAVAEEMESLRSGVPVDQLSSRQKDAARSLALQEIAVTPTATGAATTPRLEAAGGTAPGAAPTPWQQTAQPQPPGYTTHFTGSPAEVQKMQEIAAANAAGGGTTPFVAAPPQPVSEAPQGRTYKVGPTTIHEGPTLPKLQPAGSGPNGQMVYQSAEGVLYNQPTTDDKGYPVYSLYKGPPPVPAATVEKEAATLQGLDADLAMADKIAQAVKKNPKALDWAAPLTRLPGVGPIIQTKGYTEDERNTQTLIGSYGAELLHRLYGAALAGGEEARARTFEPSTFDTPASIASKINGLSEILKSKRGVHSQAAKATSAQRQGGSAAMSDEEMLNFYTKPKP